MPLRKAVAANGTGRTEEAMIASISSPRVLEIGGGAIQRIAAVLKTLGCQRPLVVTDPFLATNELFGRLAAPLDDAGIGYQVFPDTVADPTTDVVSAGLAVLNAGDFDSLIAFGGGSPIDTAKAMALLKAGGGQMRDWKVPVAPDIRVMPVVAIPTTAGTGSEMTKASVITDTETDEKMLIMGLSNVPMISIVDYELTLAKPFRLTADTGIDSLTHAIEAYVSKKASPWTDMFALNAMRLIAANLRTACFEPGNHAAREAMMLGATQAGVAFSNASVALVHGMSRPIGAHFHVPHGLSNAMLLPAVTTYSVEAAPDRYADCARAMAVADGSDPNDLAVAKLIDGLRALNRDLEVPSPCDYGIEEDRYLSLLPVMAEQALASGSPGNNPRVPTAAEIVSLYEQVWAPNQ